MTLSESEFDEVIKSLIEGGQGTVVDLLYFKDSENFYLHNGRLNKKEIMKATGWKACQLRDKLTACQEILAEYKE